MTRAGRDQLDPRDHKLSLASHACQLPVARFCRAAPANTAEKPLDAARRLLSDQYDGALLSHPAE